MDKSWPRWITASVMQHISALAIADGYEVFIEGDTRIEKARNFIELRLDGPYFKQQTKGRWMIKIEVNILIQQEIDSTNLYTIKDVQGAICSYLTDIILYEYGGIGDSSSFGCLQSLNRQDNHDHLIISNFGRIEPDANIEQSTVECHYETYLEENEPGD